MKCRLCGEEKCLIKAHIIPDFMYKNLRDDKNRIYAMEVGAELREPERKKIQSGIWDKEILCDDCDNNRLGKLEAYGATVLDQIYSKKPDVSNEVLGFSVIPEVDYPKYKLFMLSILWRTSITKRKEFSLVSLGHHENVIRNMLLNDDAGQERDYGFMIFNLLCAHEGLIALSIAPEPIKLKEHNCYRFVVAGILYFFFISNHDIHEKMQQTFPNRSGYITVIHRKDIGFIKQMVGYIRDSQTLMDFLKR